MLSGTTVQAKLQAENSRNFVGNNPSGCLYLVSDILLSSACGDSFQNVQVHAPASAQLPTHTQRVLSPRTGYIEDVVDLAGNSFVLLSAPAIDEDQGPPHTLYQLTDQGETKNGIGLDQLNAQDTYFLANYDSGFVAYGSSGRAVYYSSVGDTGTQLSLPKPSQSSSKLFNLTKSGTTTYATYAAGTPSQLADVTDPLGEQAHSEAAKQRTAPTSELVLQNEGQTKRFNFRVEPESLSICDNLACVVQDGKLDVYDLSGDKQKLLYSVYGVNEVESANDMVLVVRNDGIVRFDPKQRSGYLVYGFNDYKYCGVKVAGDSILVCVEGKGSARSILLIDPKQDVSQPVDKQVYDLTTKPGVKSISAYGNFIYITPDLSEVSFSTGFGGGYNREQLSAVNQKIRDAVNQVGFDRTKYKLVNTFDPSL